jgi:hypothetical protein
MEGSVAETGGGAETGTVEEGSSNVKGNTITSLYRCRLLLI